MLNILLVLADIGWVRSLILNVLAKKGRASRLYAVLSLIRGGC
ncbi:hypothetical protein IGI44_000505 [Enterococcus sp. DIV0756]